MLIYNPEKLRLFLAYSDDPKYVLNYIRRVMPVRSGVEIDIVGGNYAIYDKYHNKEGIRTQSEIFGWEGNKPSKPDERVEIKFSWWKHASLPIIKRYLAEMAKDPNTAVNAKGGLHIHIDLRRKLEDREPRIKGLDKLMTFYNYIRTKVFKREPLSNQKEIKHRVGTGCSASDVLVMRHHDSIEYRLGIPTFDYPTIMKQVLALQSITRSVRLDQPFNKKYLDALLSL